MIEPDHGFLKPQQNVLLKVGNGLLDIYYISFVTQTGFCSDLQHTFFSRFLSFPVEHRHFMTWT